GRQIRRPAAPLSELSDPTHAPGLKPYARSAATLRGAGRPVAPPRPATRTWSGLSAAPDAAEPWRAMQPSPVADLAYQWMSQVRNAQRGGAGYGYRAESQAGGPRRRPRRRRPVADPGGHPVPRRTPARPGRGPHRRHR